MSLHCNIARDRVVDRQACIGRTSNRDQAGVRPSLVRDRTVRLELARELACKHQSAAGQVCLCGMMRQRNS